MPDLYELPMIETSEVIQTQDPKTGKIILETFIVRSPDFGTAVPTSWGQQEDLGATMLLYIDAPAAELAKLGGFKHG